MANLRDSYVLSQSCKTLLKDHPELLPSNKSKHLINRIERQLIKELELFQRRENELNNLFIEINHSQLRFQQGCKLRNDYKAIRKGLRRVYKRGRKLVSELAPTIDPELLHEYRKSTKYLQYHMEFLQPLFPAIIKSYGGMIDKHTELLGHIRDQDRLYEYLCHEFGAERMEHSLSKIQESFAIQREELFAKVVPDSKLIYAEKTKDFIGRIHLYWNHYYQSNK
jgi:CHAD domain-containing protein